MNRKSKNGIFVYLLLAVYGHSVRFITFYVACMDYLYCHTGATQQKHSLFKLQWPGFVQYLV